MENETKEDLRQIKAAVQNIWIVVCCGALLVSPCSLIYSGESEAPKRAENPRMNF